MTDKKQLKFSLIRNIFILCGIIISIVVAQNSLKKYDNYYINYIGNSTHKIFNSDLADTLETADSFKNKLDKGENFILALPSYDRYFLPAIFIGTYYHVIKKPIYDKNHIEKKIILKNYKFGILLIQIFVYYFSVFLLSKILISKFGKKFSLIATIFLSIEPTLIQWNTSFWSEGLYLSLFIISIYFLLKIKLRNYIYSILLGLGLTLLFLQKAYAFFLIVPFIIFLIIKFKKQIKPLLLLSLSFLFFMSLIVTNNYFKSGKTYLISSEHQFYSYYSYFSHLILSDKNQISEKEAKSFLIEEEEKWRLENNINLAIKNDYLKNIEYRNQEFVKHVISNPFFVLKYFLKKTITMAILNPTWVDEWYNMDQTSLEAQKDKKKFYHKTLVRNIIYSILFYVFVAYGFFKFLKILYIDRSLSNELINFLIFNFFSVFYIILIAGLWGNPKYFIPCIVNLMFFFTTAICYKK